MPGRRAALIPLAVLLATALAGSGRRVRVEKPNLYAAQAAAFLRGRLDVEQYGYDAALRDGRIYVPFPPFPALVLVPFVVALGAHVNVVHVSMLLNVLNVLLLARILRKLDTERQAVPWLVAAFFLGTAYWWCMLASGGVWYFAHVVAVSAMLLALNEVLGKGRGLRVGLFVGAAFLSRQLSIYAWFFCAAALWRHPAHHSRRRKLLQLAALSGGLALCVGAYLWFNVARFGNPLDTGYAYLKLDGFLRERVARFGLFHPVYVPFNALYMFLQGFQLRFSEPTFLRGLKTDWFGTSLTFASPFVFLALVARWDKPLRLAAWASILVMLGQMLCYYNNGWMQVNAQRYTLDFLPLVMVLVAKGIPRASPWFWKGAIAYSVGLNAFALYGIPAFNAIVERL